MHGHLNIKNTGKILNVKRGKKSTSQVWKLVYTDCDVRTVILFTPAKQGDSLE